MRSRALHVLAVMVATGMLCGLAATDAQADDERPLKLVLAWVSPDVKAASSCQSRIGGGLHKGNTAVTHTSRAAIVSRLGLTSKDFDDKWFDLPDKSFQEGVRHIRGI